MTLILTPPPKTATFVIAASNSVNKTGANYVCTGTSDNVLISAAFAAASAAKGKLLMRAGDYYCTNHCTLPAAGNLTVEGEGRGETVIHRNSGINENWSVIQQDSAVDEDDFEDSPIQNVTIRDLEIDGGGGRPDNTWGSRNKGIMIFYGKHILIENVLIRDTGATGLGVDFWDLSLIQNVEVRDCGVNHQVNLSNSYGANGIGVYLGPWADHRVDIVNCLMTGNGNAGGVTEASAEIVGGRGIRWINCRAIGNHYGFRELGGDGTVYENCLAQENVDAGFIVGAVPHTEFPSSTTKNSQNMRLTNCVSRLNGSQGFQIEPQSSSTFTGTYLLDGLTIQGGEFNQNGVNTSAHRDGIRLDFARDVRIEGVTIFGNRRAGITAAAAYGKLQNVRISNCKIYENGYGNVGGEEGNWRAAIGVGQYNGHTCDNIEIVGVDAQPRGGFNEQEWGLGLRAGTVSNIRIRSCNFNNQPTLRVRKTAGTFTACDYKDLVGVSPDAAFTGDVA